MVQTLTYTLHSLVRVSRRGDFKHFVHVLNHRISFELNDDFNILSLLMVWNEWKYKHFRRNHLFHSLFTIKKLTWTGMFGWLNMFVRTWKPHNSHTTQKRLPFKQFQVLLTPSSGSFSSFPHGTCSLSVSRPYLAWDGTYHPLRAAIPNNSTLWSTCVRGCEKSWRGYHSPWRCFPTTLCFFTSPATYPTDYNSNLTWILNMSFSFFTRHYWRNPS